MGGGEERFWGKGNLPAGGGSFGMREQREACFLRIWKLLEGEITFLVRYRALFGMSFSLYRFLL